MGSDVADNDEDDDDDDYDGRHGHSKREINCENVGKYTLKQ